MLEQAVILSFVRGIRKDHMRLGGKKLYQILKPQFEKENIKVGRDRFFDLLRTQNLLVVKRKTRVSTTQSSHWLRKYPNLIKDKNPNTSNQIWVSDITYLKIKEGYGYISFITDAYSRKIVGYQLSDSLAAINSLKALKMALRTTIKPITGLIHHSDRGVQYCSSSYVNVLKENRIAISMTENGDPLENAIAERVNGIIKEEYLLNYQLQDLAHAKHLLRKSVALYNDKRPHLSCDNKTPSQTHKESGLQKRRWENRFKKKSSNTENVSDNLLIN